jgi:hypothetical protein
MSEMNELNITMTHDIAKIPIYVSFLARLRIHTI